MTTATQDIYDRQVDRAVMIRMYERKLAAQTDRIIERHQSDLLKVLKNDGIVRNNPNITKEVKKTWDEIKTLWGSSFVDFAKTQLDYTRDNLDAAMGRIWRTVQPSIRIAEEIALKKPIKDDRIVFQLADNLAMSERAKIEQVIRGGLASGLSEAEIVARVRNQGIKITRNQARGVVRTGITSISNQADFAVYEANDKALKGWQFVAVLDSRTTNVCAYHDGKIYDIGDDKFRPPLHWNCRSTTIPVVKSYEDLASLQGIAELRKRNLKDLNAKQRAYYDGLSPAKESYDSWLRRQPVETQRKHFGDDTRLSLFTSGKLFLDKFTDSMGNAIGLKALRRDSVDTPLGTTTKFDRGLTKLNELQLGVLRPDDLIDDVKFQNALKEYYRLQVDELNGTLSLMPYRGTTIAGKKRSKDAVLNTPPDSDSYLYDPVTNTYRHKSIYPQFQEVLENSKTNVLNSELLKQKDKDFITKFVDSTEGFLGTNERAAITDNLRLIIERARRSGEPWGNFKAVLNSEMQFSVANVSDFIETQLRKDANVLKKLTSDSFIDPVLGPTTIEALQEKFLRNIKERAEWEESVSPKIAIQMKRLSSSRLPIIIKNRLDEVAKIEKKWFGLFGVKQVTQEDLLWRRIAGRIANQETPDYDTLAVSIGKDAYNSAKLRGDINDWRKLGVSILDDQINKGWLDIETVSVTKRRFKKSQGRGFAGPVYDTFSKQLRVVEPRLRRYNLLNREIDVAVNLGFTDDSARFVVVPGKENFQQKLFPGIYRDTKIPVFSSGAQFDVDPKFVDKDIANLLNQATGAKHKVDKTFYEFMSKLLKFQDDKGQAQLYNELNTYRKYITNRADAYSTFKTLEFYSNSGKAFSNYAYLDSRARVYARGFLSPQSGESFRPFLSTEFSKPLTVSGYANLGDQIGAFLGGASDFFERNYSSLTVTGRQEIFQYWKKDLIALGNAVQRGKPGDIRFVLNNKIFQGLEGEEQGKLLRFALEVSKIDDYLEGVYTSQNLKKLDNYLVDVAFEQDASSSGAQIIALTTKNKQLAELSNVVPTTQKRRLYDEIAASTFADPRFQKLNQRLGLKEKDLRKAAKQQNMVTFYGAGEATGIMSVESKLAKVLGSKTNTLVVTRTDVDKIVEQIDIVRANLKRRDPITYEELTGLRKQVIQSVNKAEAFDSYIVQALESHHIDTKDFVEKVSRNYDRVVTPQDFKEIAQIMSGYLEEQVPILGKFTKYFGRLAETYMTETGKAEISWVTFDGKIINQVFSRTMEDRFTYFDETGRRLTNIVQFTEKSDPPFYERLLNIGDGKFKDVADVGKARTAFAVNGNHSNDAAIVRKFHLWGKDKGIQTSTIHDAFFTNAADMLEAKRAIRQIYADQLKENPVLATLKQLRKDGLSWKSYNKFLNQAIEEGLIPVPGRSIIGGKKITKEDILTIEDVLKDIGNEFDGNYDWYGIGP
jgi:SPP1 gp7 family putative phage head morphogenesis protein